MPAKLQILLKEMAPCRNLLFKISIGMSNLAETWAPLVASSKINLYLIGSIALKVFSGYPAGMVA